MDTYLVLGRMRAHVGMCVRAGGWAGGWAGGQMGGYVSGLTGGQVGGGAVQSVGRSVVRAGASVRVRVCVRESSGKAGRLAVCGLVWGELAWGEGVWKG